MQAHTDSNSLVCHHMLRVALFDNSSAKCLIINPFKNVKVITKATRCSVTCTATSCLWFLSVSSTFQGEQMKLSLIKLEATWHWIWFQWIWFSITIYICSCNLVVSYIVSYHPGTHNVSIIVIFCLKRSSICRYPSNV